MLHFLLGYLTGAGIDARWVVIEGNQDFFEVTKRLHHLLHGQPGDGGELDEPARASYRQTLKETLAELQQQVEPGDVVVVHDPQTAGLVPALKRQGAVVIDNKGSRRTLEIGQGHRRPRPPTMGPFPQ